MPAAVRLGLNYNPARRPGRATSSRRGSLLRRLTQAITAATVAAAAGIVPGPATPATAIVDVQPRPALQAAQRRPAAVDGPNVLHGIAAGLRLRPVPPSPTTGSRASCVRRQT